MRASKYGLLVIPALAFACAQGSSEEPAMENFPASTADAGEPEASSPHDPASWTIAVDKDRDGVEEKDDCDDNDPAVHPGATESCNGKDDNCDGKVDEGLDVDGDGYLGCDVAGQPADCDDNDPAIHPGAAETCNGKDDNCDGKIDEPFDKDGDGSLTCERDGKPLDCNDDDPSVNPGASEICNGKDDDCDGKIDELPALLNGSFAPLDSHWALAGNAAVGAPNTGVWLTPDQTWKAGALWWTANYLFDSFDVTMTFWVQNKGTQCADGIAFAWVPGNDVSKVGSNGFGHGVLGLGGYAVVIDTFKNEGQPNAPFLSIHDNQTGEHLHRASGLPEVRNGIDRSLRVKLDGGKVSVWLSGTNYINDFAIPSYVPFSGHWGFTAGTGGLGCIHAVKNASMSFPNGQGCVP